MHVTGGVFDLPLLFRHQIRNSQASAMRIGRNYVYRYSCVDVYRAKESFAGGLHVSVRPPKLRVSDGVHTAVPTELTVFRQLRL